MAHRPRFDINRPLVASREFIFAGVKFTKGDPFPVRDFALRLIKRQYEAHAISHTDEQAMAPEPVTMTGPQGGRYTIKAPWLEKPEVVRGKANADARFAELKAEGAPLGWIEGGSAVTVEGGEGGWYQVNAPWLEEADTVQGREAAEVRQRELHAAGAPEGWEPEGEGFQDGEDSGDGSETGGEGDQGGETDTGASQAGQGDGDADAGAGGNDGADQGAGENQDPADPHKGAAEKIPGTGPAKAADDVVAAAGKAKPPVKIGAVQTDSD